MKNIPTTKHVIALASLLLSGAVATQIALHHDVLRRAAESLNEYRQASRVMVEAPITPVPKSTPANQPTSATDNDDSLSTAPVPLQAPTQDSSPWGVATKVDDVTYSIKVGYDDRMATPQEVMEALNKVRNANGVQTLSWDDTLGAYAQSRAQHFKDIGTTDKHAGFDAFLEHEDGFRKLGFNRVGENSYFGGPLTGTHMIEWVFTQSPGHNANQLDPGWTHVGVGTTDTSANLIFGSH